MAAKDGPGYYTVQYTGIDGARSVRFYARNRTDARKAFQHLNPSAKIKRVRKA